MTKPSFAQYLLQSRTQPALAHKSAFELYQSYQRLGTRAHRFSVLPLWRRFSHT